MKRILFVGDANNFLIIQLVHWIGKESDFKVEIIHTLNTRVNSPEYFHRVYSFHIPDLLFTFPFVGRWYRTSMIRGLLRKMQYNFCCAHIHAAKRVYTGILKELSKRTGKIILTIWGSDFNLVSDRIKRQLLPLLQQTDIITFATVKQRDLVVSHYPDIDPDKTRIIKFGLNTLEIIKNTDKDPGTIKRYFNIPKDRVVITIGYNASPNQQHFRILESLTANEKLIKRSGRFVLLFPLTYGGTTSYIRKLSEALADSPFTYVLFNDYLSDEEVAWLRIVSDIMIQLQKKDQFSGSMQEYLFAENVVITGSWLPYDELKQAGVYFREEDDIEKTGDMLEEILEDLTHEKIRCLKNRDKIYSISSWAKNIYKWLALYE